MKRLITAFICLVVVSGCSNNMNINKSEIWVVGKKTTYESKNTYYIMIPLNPTEGYTRSISYAGGVNEFEVGDTIMFTKKTK